MRRVPVTLQRQPAECAAACLAMMARHHGAHLTLADARHACRVTVNGTSAHHLARAAEQLGFDVTPVRCAIGALESASLPAIAHWEASHFVVVERVGARWMHIVDPAVGRRRVARTGGHATDPVVILELTPGPRFERRRPMATMLPTPSRAQRRAYRTFFAAGLALEAVALALPVATQTTFDALTTHTGPTRMFLAVLALGVAGVLRAATIVVQDQTQHRLKEHAGRRATVAFVRHLLRLPYARLLPITREDLVQRVENHWIVTAGGALVQKVVCDVIFATAFAAVLFAYDARLAGLILIAGAVKVLLAVGIRGVAQRAQSAELRAHAREHSTLVQACAGFEALCASGAAQRLGERYRRDVDERLGFASYNALISALRAHAMSCVDGVLYGALIYVGATRMLAGAMTLGALAACLFMQQTFGRLCGGVVESIAGRARLRAVLEHALDLSTSPPEQVGGFEAEPLGSVELVDVSFRYNVSQPYVLRGASLRIAPGEHVAIVGSSGVGKSTVLKLILGLLTPSEGHVTINGRPLSEWNLAALRRRLGVVLQETWLDPQSLRDHLSLYDVPETGQPDGALLAAVCKARADEPIAGIPGGIDAPLADFGHRLSGGERQRLSLARALVHDPAILLLDEATSALDRVNEEQILGAVLERRRTTILVTHRPRIETMVDRVVCLRDGVLVDVNMRNAPASRSTKAGFDDREAEVA